MPGKDIVYNIALTIVSRQRIDGVISDLFDRQFFILPLAHQHLNERRCGKLIDMLFNKLAYCLIGAIEQADIEVVDVYFNVGTVFGVVLNRF